MNGKLVVLLAVIAVLGTSGIVATVIAKAESSSSTDPIAAAPPDWVQAIVSRQVQWCGSPNVDSAVWVLTDYASAETRLDQQPGPRDQGEYLVVLTADTEFVRQNGFGPTGEPSRGKYIELLINADSHIIDTFGIGNDVVKLDGLGQVSSYPVK